MNLGTTVMDTSLAYDRWGTPEFVLAFGGDLATRVIAHNSGSGQPVEPGIASGANLGNGAATPINNTTRTTVTNASAASTTTLAAGATQSVASMLAVLGPEFMARLKEQLTDSTVGAEDEANLLDANAHASASFQDQINAMNENGASSILVAPFDKVEVTGVRQNPHP